MGERVYPWKGEVMITGDRYKGNAIKSSIPKDSELTEKSGHQSFVKECGTMENRIETCNFYTDPYYP